jgi:hypothetical protein
LGLILADLFHFVNNSQYRATSISSIETVGSLALARSFICKACRNVARDPIGVTNICETDEISIRTQTSACYMNANLPPPQCHGN